MSKQVKEMSSSDSYKQRYEEYQTVYCETSQAMMPEPSPEPMPGDPSAAANTGAAKTALKRQVRYNKPGLRQSVKPKGVTNASNE